jgi:hypothetical protein
VGPRLPATILAALALVAVPIAGGAGAAESPTVEVRDVTVDVDRDLGSQFGGRVDVTVRFRVANTGDASVQPTACIELESQIGGGTTSAPIELEELRAGEHVDITRTAGSLLPFGSAHVTVTVRSDGELAHASASTPVIPWLLLVVIVAVLVIVLAARRARQPRPGNEMGSPNHG